MSINSPFKYTSKAAKQSDNEFEQLKRQWYKTLKDQGFKDIEKPTGEIKRPETRTIAWANQDVIREFFLHLDSWLNKHGNDIPVEDKMILDLYTKGLKPGEICKLVKPCRTKVLAIIRKYKQIILTEYHL